MDILNLTYSQILNHNNALKMSIFDSNYNVSIVSNVIVEQISGILEFYLKHKGIGANVKTGNYDNIAQDSYKLNNSDLMLIFFEISNIMEGLEYKFQRLSQLEESELFENIKLQISFILVNVQKSPIVLFNKFSSSISSLSSIGKTKYDLFVDRLNFFLEDSVPSNVIIIDVDKIILKIGVKNSINARNYRYSKSPYSVDFFKEYVNYVMPIVLSASAKAKKALVMDCDNTLWKGVLGEVGFNKIEMSYSTNDGSIFEDVQNLILSLVNDGVILCLVSKNNYEDIDNVINNHCDSKIRDNHIAIRKINWKDKSTNILEISQELNIGLDSIVFVDDSTFEVNGVKEMLPEVYSFQVPERLYEYTYFFKEKIAPLFYNLSNSEEDTNKTEIYKNQIHRKNEENNFINVEDYLASLNIELHVSENCKNSISRISQITQKTNQFNLTTNRYTKGEIKNFMECKINLVLSFDVTDRFGKNGITGLCILKYTKKDCVEIDTLLMSCRIIGRNIEFAFMNYLVKKLKNSGVRKVKSKYIKSNKNKQVSDFYMKCGFQKINAISEMETKYFINLSEYKCLNVPYIKVLNA